MDPFLDNTGTLKHKISGSDIVNLIKRLRINQIRLIDFGIKIEPALETGYFEAYEEILRKVAL